jgi:hypothetical protein
MILPQKDAVLFYKLMLGVQHYINLQTGTLKGVKSADEFSHLSSEERLEVRDLIWKHPELMDDYIRANPDLFSDGELDILRSWKSHFFKGTFYIFRHLKKGTIFIGEKDKVYLVIGLMTPFEELVPGYVLPQMVEAVLLPFKGMIIYDSLFSSYPLIIGGNIRANLNHVYQVARQKERIITSFDPDSKPAAPSALPRPSKLAPKLAEIDSELATIKGDTTLQNAALSLARASLDLAMAAANGMDMVQHRRKVRKASTHLENLMDIEKEE